MDCHISPRLIAPTSCFETPNATAICRSGAFSSLIISASRRDIFADGLPFSFREPPLARPFAFMSAILSALVPRNRCSGLQHGGLSQAWSTQRPSGIWPLCISQLTRCAPTLLRFPRLPRYSTPYPWETVPHQSQQPSVFLTFIQNLSSKVRILTMYQSERVLQVRFDHFQDAERQATSA